MKIILHVLAVALCCAQPSFAQTKTGRERAGLFGPVHIVRSETAQLSNVNGRLIEGVRAAGQTLTFDEQGNLTEWLTLNPIPPYKWGARWAYTYDATGRVTEELFHNADGIFAGRTLTVYDDKAGTAARTEQDYDGSIITRTELTFDGRRKVTREIDHDSKGALRETKTYTYDEHGWLLERSANRPDGRVILKRIYTHDAQGRTTGWTVYNHTGLPTTRFIFAFDDKGNPVENRSYEHDVLMRTETFTYAFDPQGNWINSIIETVYFFKGQPQSTTRGAQHRIITYY